MLVAEIGKRAIEVSGIMSVTVALWAMVYGHPTIVIGSAICSALCLIPIALLAWRNHRLELTDEEACFPIREVAIH